MVLPENNMNKLILFDFEVFKYDTLLGALIISEDKLEVIQTWDLEKIKKIYQEYSASFWIGHNNQHYDNFILEAVCRNENTYKVSKEIIEEDKKKYLNIQLYNYDLMVNHFGSLKAIECADGKNISESKVSFDIDRPLTEEEKREVESYNLDDLDQTLDDFLATKNEFQLRLEIIKEFDLDLDCLSITGTRLAEKVLKAKKIKGIENQYIAPPLYPDLQVKNQDVLNFYLLEGFRKGKSIKVNLCGVEHKYGSGGLHAARKKSHKDSLLYFDVTGYYNLVMILKDLLPRSIGEEGKELYNHMYQQQLILKKTNPLKRAVYKIILLAVFGAMNNEYCAFYDPMKGSLVTMVGQMYITDLLEKMEGKGEVFQTNTDGIMAYPVGNTTVEELKDIIKEWMNRTGFNLKLVEIKDVYQRDVNNYMYRKMDGTIVTKGDSVKYYNHWENSLDEDIFKAREPAILHYTTVEFFMEKLMPEKVIEKYKNNLRMFQFICKKNSYDYLEYEETNLNTGEIKTTRIQDVNRAFPLKSTNVVGRVNKRKKNGEKSKVASLPDSIFIYNQEILSPETVEKLKEEIDYSYYIDRAIERISEFIDIYYIKDLKI